jgi:hypothetical protein
MKRSILSALACLLASLTISSTPVWSKEPAPKVIARGTQVGVVNLLNAEVTHYHIAKDSNNSFLKMLQVSWPVDDMLTSALKDPLAQAGLTATPLTPTDALERARESCFVNASLENGLAKKCSAPLMEQASTGGVSYLIVMAPGLNDANHAGSNRIESVTATMRGWGFLTSERAGPKDKPTLFNEVELLLIGVSPEGVTLQARQWGGVYTMQWQTYAPTADPRQIPSEQLDQLQPLYAALLARQARELLNQVHIEP